MTDRAPRTPAGGQHESDGEEATLRFLVDDLDRGAPSVLRITVEDLSTGETQSREIPAGDYFIVTTGPAYVDSIQGFKNGTHQITVKGRTLR